MAISPITPNYDNSSWYKIMQELAEFWENYGKENDINFTGEYSHYSCSFEGSRPFKNGTLKISGNREYITLQISATIKETFTFCFTSNAPSDGFVEIKPSSLMDFINLKGSKVQKEHLSQGKLIYYNDQVAKSTIQQSGIFEFESFESFKLEKGKLISKFRSIPKNLSEMQVLETLMNLIEKIST